MKKDINTFLGVIIIILAASIMILGMALYLNIKENNKKESKSDIPTTSTNVNKNDNEKKENVVNSKIGDLIVLDSLKSIDTGYNTREDYSNWYFLSEDNEYVTLMLNKTAYKTMISYDYVTDNFKRSFIQNNIDFGNNGEFRYLNNEDLKLFNCNMETLICNNNYNWLLSAEGAYKHTITSITKDNKVLVLKENNKLEYIDDSAEIAAIPVIKILKTNLK